ncbi:hypothetical protein SAMN06264849_10892 [Melghirimyces algeriensis]|uniref:Uncharacterized protein n=1 Tax=Melghirimyces algeriensis TaxID=910412 RepID=A0A521E9Z8_9BACL|nr:hypothetical protein SAMN06264849_10892 [Melghirimyces algeriensis]
MLVDPYLLQIESRKKHAEMIESRTIPKQARPSIYHRIRCWFTQTPPLVREQKNPAPEIVPFPPKPSNLHFLKLYQRHSYRRFSSKQNRPSQ